MNIKMAIGGAMLLPIAAMAQAYNPATGQRHDQYGRPLASVEDLCREGQMAGGPITQKCATYGYQFNHKGERLVRYDFTKWGYNLLTQVPEATAIKLDSDPKYRAAYIKAQHIKRYVKKPQSDDEVVGRLDGKDITRGEFRERCANTSYKYSSECR